jgi:protein ImuA
MAVFSIEQNKNNKWFKAYIQTARRESQSMSAAVFKQPSPPHIGPNPGLLAHLRARVQTLEHPGARAPQAGARTPARPIKTVSVGAAAIDAALPWNGLPAQGLHEIFGDAAAFGFCASLLVRLLADTDAPILWCRPARDAHGELYGQGLAAAGLDPERLILVHGRDDTEILWAMEEGLRSAALAAVVGSPRKIPPIAGRRLQLAAEESGTAGLLLRPEDNGGHQAATSAALSRWRVLSAPSQPARGSGGRIIAMGPPEWRLELQRCRFAMARGQNLREAGKPRAWLVEWCNETGNFPMVAALRDGSAATIADADANAGPQPDKEANAA